LQFKAGKLSRLFFFCVIINVIELIEDI